MNNHVKAIITENSISIPLTVPTQVRDTYLQNYLKATTNTGRLFLFAGDQKIEHLNDDFYGEGIAPEAANPEHLFHIASKGRIGCFATQLGLIARYGQDFPNVRYIVKLNAKSNLVSPEHAEPLSLSLHTVDQVIEFKKHTGLDIVGIGYTIYLGSQHEADMFTQAAQAVYTAHQHGLITVLWIYPRGKAVTQERAAPIIAGAASVGVCLGADFVKVNPPEAATSFDSAQLLTQAAHAAGRTKIICSGGKRRSEEQLLEELYHQIHVGGAAGTAVGRNIHQRSLEDALKLCQAIATIVMDDGDVEAAKKYLI